MSNLRIKFVIGYGGQKQTYKYAIKYLEYNMVKFQMRITKYNMLQVILNKS